MKEPVRWRDDGSVEAETRALLANDQADAPPERERERIWAGMVPQIQMLPAPPPVIPAAPVAATGAAALLGKITLGVALVTGVGAGVHVARSRTPVAQPTQAVRAPAPAPTGSSAPLVSIVQPVAPVAPAPVVERPVGHRHRPSVPTPAPEKAIEIQDVPATAPAPMVISNELLEEGQRLSRARAALRAHDAEGALRLLQSGPTGSAGLSQEREALTIEALWLRPGARSQAEKRARAFMTAYPDSPYRARLKALVLGQR
jgi:hypothetical protein